MIFTIIPFSIVSSNAATNFEYISSSTVIDSKYSFSPRFISGVSKLETFGATSTFEEDCWTNDGVPYASSCLPVRLTDNSQKGKVGAWYRNIGEYNGVAVDLKITIMDWKELRKPFEIDGKMSYPSVTFNGGGIAIHSSKFMIKEPKYRFEFYQNGTPVKVPGHMTFRDIDITQYVQSDDFDTGYLTSDTGLKINGNKVYSLNEGDKEATDTRYWITYTWDSSYFEFIFSNQQGEDMDFSKAITLRAMDSMFTTGEPLAPFDTPAPVKSGTANVQSGDSVAYNISFTVPKQPTGMVYKTFNLTDTLPDGLKYTGFKVVNDAGTNVTSQFTASVNGQKFTLTPKNLSLSSFYFKGYKVTINAVAEDKDWKSYVNNDGKVILKNKAKITASIGDVSQVKTSNEINTEVLFKITTKTDGNGTITESISGIHGGEDKVISFSPKAGFEVDTVTIDGKEVSGYPYEYTFNDISKNHEISVTFKPVYRQLGIAKIIDPKDVNISYGRPTAIFKVEGTDVTGQKHEYEYVIPLRFVSEGSGTPYDGMYAGIITDIYRKVPEVPAGTYTITEVKTSHYDVESVYAESGKVTSDNTVICDLVNNKEAIGVFTNTITNYNGFSHSELKYNPFIQFQGAGNIH